MDAKVQRERALAFLELHHGPHILVLPNAWDASSAKIFEQAGFSAIGTTSAGIAAVFGYPDGEAISRSGMMRMIERITHTVSLPVSADLEAGYGGTPEAVAKTIQDVIAAGAVGMNLEDSTRLLKKPLADISKQIERIQVAREVADAANLRLVVNARTDVYLRAVGPEANRFRETLRRANAYREAGADCLFVPGVQDRETIAALVREIQGPVNILATAGSPTVAELEQLGVARVSVGSGPMRATLVTVRKIAEELCSRGTFEFLTPETPSHGDVNRMFD